MAVIAANHRLRISRTMVLIYLLVGDPAIEYLDSLDKAEAQNLLHNLQTLLADTSIIDRFTFSTFEQVAFGIDTFHTVQKIKRLLQERLILTSRHVCNHRNVGVMLDSYF